ncbi:MAG: Na+/H+ antiporter subunit C [Chloroflexales bacterium]|nr:Na+/H+ antiporter subunit C [Chloroflexales bacterium]
MELLWALVIGALYAAGIYMILRLSLVKVIIGLMLLGHGTNLLIFTSARLTRGAPPLIAPDANALVAPYADPLPQALVLTAIVIGFGVQAFALVLFKRAYQSVGADDLNQLRDTDKET